MAICQRIIEAHGGHIGVAESCHGSEGVEASGAIITFELPIS